jgi:hypothetical protein
MSELLEGIARAICVVEGVDPDMPCPGLGNLIPVGETWPAWRVRLPKAEAARDVTMARLTADLARLEGEPERNGETPA